MRSLLPLLLVVASCHRGHGAAPDGNAAPDGPGDGSDAGHDAAVDAARDAAIDARPDAFVPMDAPDPNDLLATGLCVDAACTMISPDVRAFEPRWHLWADGATKRRWIQLPAGTKIDTSNVDYWQFPVGTKLWKEFTLNGVRVETRYLTRIGPNPTDWAYMGYEWNAAQSHAIAQPNGDTNVNGTTHDIPAQATCRGCHTNNATPVLGFSAFQLDYAAPAGNVDLDHAIAAGWLTQNPPGAASPHYPLPGTPTDQAMLGYVHANCGHCHNSDSQLTSHPMLRIESAHADVMTNTRLYQSTVNVVARTPFEGATIIVVPRDAASSVIVKRTTTTDLPHRMPALGIKTVDPTGQTIIRAWIDSL